jgi:hypothetical protein
MDDSYRNLTLKGIAVLNWVRQHCAKADLVFKVDDDIYVNVHNLVNFVRSNYQSNNSLFGYVWSEPHANRNKDDKFYLSLEEYPWSHYPNYISGGAYFMHASVVIPLLAASQTIPFSQFEDVFLTGMCREKAGVKMRHSAGQPRFLFYTYQTLKMTVHFLVYMIYYLLKCLLSSASAIRSAAVCFAGIHRVADKQSICHPLGRRRILSEQDPVRRHRIGRNEKNIRLLCPHCFSVHLVYDRGELY